MKKNCFKSILSLVLLVLGLAVSGSANATISSTAATSITSGSKYLISYTSGSTTYYLTSTGGYTTTASESDAMTITTSGSTCTIKNLSGNYLQNATTISFSSTSASWTYSYSSGFKFTYTSGSGRQQTTYNLRYSASNYKWQSSSSNSQTLQLYEVTDAPTYTVTCSTVTGGTISATPTSATEGTTITLSNTPATGYDFVSYSSDDVTISGNTFTMPAKNVTVSGTFQAQTPNAITSFTAASSYVKVGATTTATLVKADGYTGEINYSITNNGAATVTQDGDAFTIVGVANGTVVINATATDQTGYKGNSVTLTITVTTSHIPSNYSTSWTTSNEIYLYNKATGLYLGSGGHWGTEGILKTTGLPFYMDAAASEKSDATGVGVFSDSGKTTAHKVGYQSSAQVFGIENQGLYIDAGTNYPGQTFSFYFNSDDNSYSIVPDAMVTGFAITGTNSEGKTVYLTAGGSQTLSWETTPYYWSMDSSNRLYAVYGSTASSLGTAYRLYSNGSTIYMSTTGSTCSIDGNGYFTIGSYYLTGNSTSVTSSSSTSSALGTKYEQGTSSKFYLTQNGGTSVARQNIVTVRQYSTTDIPDEARWFVVTKADLIEDFENATASSASPKEATFLLTNPDFSREVTQGWTFQQPTGTAYTSQTSSYGSNGYIRIGNALFNNAGPNNSINNSPNSVEVAGTAIGSGSYGGNGSGYTLDATAAEYANLPEGTSTYYNIPYGGFYNCRILGNSGKVYQQVTITKAGYYRVSCDGYVYNPSGATGTATFYAKNIDATAVGKQWVTTALPTNSTFETMTDAGITFYANGKTSPYHTSILVYMPAGTMEIGVILAGGTIGTVKNSNTNTFAEFDAMKIEYTGDSQFDIILDESLTDANVSGSTTHYINAQVYNTDPTKIARTMYLKRSMKTGQWNTIVLPVNISNSAFNTAFGADAKLTKFDYCSGNWIYFTLVDHADEKSTTPAMEAGKCYLIKPNTISAATKGDYETDYANATGSIKVTATTDVPVFTFNQVTLAEEIDDYPNYDGHFAPTNDKLISNYLAFMGTYFYNEAAIGQYSYAIDSSDGSWKRWTGTDNLACKGFRCWIGQLEGQTIPTSNAKLTLVINGEEVAPTDIAGVTVDQPTNYNGRVYNINGQEVGSAENINKLPKGIYISNGKKIIVK